MSAIPQTVNITVPVPPVVGRIGVELFLRTTSSWLFFAADTPTLLIRRRSALSFSRNALVDSNLPVRALFAPLSPLRSTVKEEAGL